jgi:hypothetical protein
MLTAALDFDQTVFLVASHHEQAEAERAQRNRDTWTRNNERRRAIGLPLEAAPLA